LQLLLARFALVARVGSRQVRTTRPRDNHAHSLATQTLPCASSTLPSQLVSSAEEPYSSFILFSSVFKSPPPPPQDIRVQATASAQVRQQLGDVDCCCFADTFHHACVVGGTRVCRLRYTRVSFAVHACVVCGSLIFFSLRRASQMRFLAAIQPSARCLSPSDQPAFQFACLLAMTPRF
jgi:hypothetical protein